MATSSTPVFDLEILKLRRRLGDIFNDDGSEITNTTNTVSSSWVGYSTITGGAWKRDELVDIYNRSVWSFLDYMTSIIPKERWYEFVQGYIFYKQSVPVSSGIVSMSSVSPTIYKVIDLALDSGSPSPSNQGIEVSPYDFLSAKNGYIKTRKPSANVLLYSIMSEGVLGSATQNIYVLPSSVSSVDLIYLRIHDSITHNGTTDLFGISPNALQRILIFAEIESKSSKYINSQTNPLQELSLQNQFDNKVKG